MKLLAARIQNYRSIVDSDVVEIDQRLTVLVGKNEQGKTTFLQALTSFGSNAPYKPSNLPRHLRGELERKPAAEIPIVTLWLTAEEPDLVKLNTLVPDSSGTPHR